MLKDKILKEGVVGTVYHIPCDTCEASYIGETERSLKSKFMEHRRPSSTISEVSHHIHHKHPDHQVDIERAKIVAVEPRWFEWGARENIYIRTERPSLNKDGGRYNLTTIWNNVLKSRVRRPGPRTLDNTNLLQVSCHLGA